jgi:hypothetical protein
MKAVTSPEAIWRSQKEGRYPLVNSEDFRIDGNTQPVISVVAAMKTATDFSSILLSFLNGRKENEASEITKAIDETKPRIEKRLLLQQINNEIKSIRTDGFFKTPLALSVSISFEHMFFSNSCL